MNNLIIIMPVKYQSKRLKNKNILPINNMPMFVYVAKKFLKQKIFTRFFVSTESKKIKNLCKKYGIKIINRPKHLSKSNVEKQAVIVHAVKKINNIKKNDIIISLQPNSPEVKPVDIKKAINFFKNKLYKNSKIKELICVNSKNIQNPSFRIMTYDAVFQKTLSTKLGIYFADYEDIHEYKDYIKAKNKIEKNNYKKKEKN
jgi:CMP-N-acetylneuraminic acid synthetase